MRTRMLHFSKGILINNRMLNLRFASMSSPSWIFIEYLRHLLFHPVLFSYLHILIKGCSNPQSLSPEWIYKSLNHRSFPILWHDLSSPFAEPRNTMCGDREYVLSWLSLTHSELCSLSYFSKLSSFGSRVNPKEIRKGLAANSIFTSNHKHLCDRWLWFNEEGVVLCCLAGEILMLVV